ncbi:helix-turn-helix domain-containing protein [Streptomyces sp. NBC_01525]|uniref:helix-turn-helix domain-containing protein n=1 Tax=Streptomyces sp. NBC_01525 TaxID=2903893 RepID=UPI0038689152
MGREHRAWTLAVLGDRLGCFPATVSHLERRSRVVDLDLVHRASCEVGVPRHVLVSSLDVVSFGEAAVGDEGCGDADEGEEVLRFAFVASVEASAAAQP